MPRRTLAAAAACLTLLTGSGAQACGFGVEACESGTVVWPAYTVTGRRIGTIEAQVQAVPRLETSRTTGQPRDVIYNNPNSMPGAIDPGLDLVRLPSVAHRHTQAVYPVGY